MENTGCIGTDLNSGVPSSSDHDCQNKCAVSTGCEDWTRNRDGHDSPGARGKCYLKDACSKKISNPATSGPKFCGCFMENTGCIGTDLNSGVPSSSDHDCQNKCAVSTGCEYWTRNRDDHDSPGARGKCYLKDACSKKISNPATSGPKSCGC